MSVNVWKPNECSEAAPLCLAMPIAIILARPLSCGPRKSVWGFTLLKMTMPSDSKAALSHHSGSPSRSPNDTTSMLDTMGMPHASSVTP